MPAIALAFLTPIAGGFGYLAFRLLRRLGRYLARRADARARAVVSDAVSGTPVVREIRNDVKTITGQVGDLSTRVRTLETRTNREENARPGGRRWSDPPPSGKPARGR